MPALKIPSLACDMYQLMITYKMLQEHLALKFTNREILSPSFCREAYRGPNVRARRPLEASTKDGRYMADVASLLPALDHGRYS